MPPELEPNTVASAELRERMSLTLGRVRFGGERILVTTHGVPVAALVPVEDLDRLAELGQVPVPVVEVAVDVDAAVDRVWRVVSDVRVRGVWSGSLTLDPHLDGEVEDRWFTPDGRLTVLRGRVTAADTTGGIELEWAERGCPGRTTVRLQVHPQDQGSRITVVETGWARGDLARAEQHATRWREHLAALAHQCVG